MSRISPKPDEIDSLSLGPVKAESGEEARNQEDFAQAPSEVARSWKLWFLVWLRSLRDQVRLSRRLGGILSNYVIREVSIPTATALIILTLLILTKDILGFMDFVINRGFGVSIVAMIAFYEIVPLASRTLPFAVLVGTLVGLGRLKFAREIIAIEAAGVSGRRLLGPVLAFATVAMTGGLGLSLFAAPWATRSLETALRQMATENPGLSLRAGSVREFNGVKLIAREVSADGDQLRGVLLWVPDRGQTLFAERGEITAGNEGVMQLVLHDGMMLRTPSVRGEETHFEHFFQPLRDEPGQVRRNEDFLVGASLDEVAIVAWGGAEDQELARRAQIEFHRRLSYPFACLSFACLAVPLALLGTRFSRAVGGVTGLLVTLIYYGCMQLGDGLMQADILSPGTGVWLPNSLVIFCALALLGGGGLWSRRKRKEPRPQEASDQSQSWLIMLLPQFQRYILPRYVAQHYLQLLVVSFVVLLTGYLLVDILERLQWFARYHADALKALRFYSVRIPWLVSQIVPMAVLLATTLTVNALSAHRELIGLRSCGISVLSALAPVLFISGLVAPAYFVLNEVIVPRTNALAEQIKNQEIKNRTQIPPPLSRMIWYREGLHVYQADQMDSRLGLAKGLSIYRLDANGLPVERIDAPAATYIGQGVWELVNPLRIEISDRGFRETPAETRIHLGEAPSEPLDTKQLGLRELFRQIRDTEASGYDATIYRVDFHVKLAAPIACLLLPIIALLFATSGPPFPGPAVTLLASIVVGISYILLTGMCASFGYSGALPPILAGWGPSIGYAVLAGMLTRRSLG
jgi:lipopolysaccharide export system permease protein